MRYVLLVAALSLSACSGSPFGPSSEMSVPTMAASVTAPAVPVVAEPAPVVPPVVDLPAADDPEWPVVGIITMPGPVWSCPVLGAMNMLPACP